MNQKIWHNLDVEQTLHSLGSSRQGLSQQEAQRRLSQYGANELQASVIISRLPLIVVGE